MSTYNSFGGYGLSLNGYGILLNNHSKFIVPDVGSEDIFDIAWMTGCKLREEWANYDHETLI